MEIIAHRGASAQAPENTLAAFHLAWQQGADGIELDVRLSRDGRVMVHHDQDTRRTAGVSRNIAATESARLRGLDVGRWKGEQYAGQTMPFLEEVLAVAPTGSRILVEIKCGPEIILPLRAILKKTNRRLRLAVVAFDLDTLSACRKAVSQFDYYWIVGSKPDKRGALPPYFWQLIELAKTHDLAGLDVEYHAVTPDFITAVHAAGLSLLTWTVNDADEARRLRDCKVDALATDHPAEIRQALIDEQDHKVRDRR